MRSRVGAIDMAHSLYSEHFLVLIVSMVQCDGWTTLRRQEICAECREWLLLSDESRTRL